MPALAEPRRRHVSRVVFLDRALEALPLFRLSDSVDDSSISHNPGEAERWRVLPSPGDRVPGTFDQDVYVEIMRRYHDAGAPEDGVVRFTLHAFLRSMGRRVDGRTYEQLRSALNRLLRTRLESRGAYRVEPGSVAFDGQFSVFSAVSIDRRRDTDRSQLSLFNALTASEPGEASVTLAPGIRANLAAGHSTTLVHATYLALTSPVARRLYRLLQVARANGERTWRVPLETLASSIPLAQRYPSHLQRVLQPAHEMLVHGGVALSATVRKDRRNWFAEYRLDHPASAPG